MIQQTLFGNFIIKTYKTMDIGYLPEMRNGHITSDRVYTDYASRLRGICAITEM